MVGTIRIVPAQTYGLQNVVQVDPPLSLRGIPEVWVLGQKLVDQAHGFLHRGKAIGFPDPHARRDFSLHFRFEFVEEFFRGFLARKLREGKVCHPAVLANKQLAQLPCQFGILNVLRAAGVRRVDFVIEGPDSPRVIGLCELVAARVAA